MDITQTDCKHSFITSRQGSEAGVYITDATEGQRQAFGSLMNQRVGGRFWITDEPEGRKQPCGSLMN